MKATHLMSGEAVAMLKEGGDVGDGGFETGGVDFLGRPSEVGGEIFDGGEGGWWLFRGWRRRPEAGAGDEVFAGVGVDHELLRAGAAHGAGVGFDGDEIEAAASEDAAVGVVVSLVAEGRGRPGRCRRSRRPS